MNDMEKNKIIYEKAKEYLKEILPKEISNIELEEYFNIEKKFTTKQEIFYRICESLQNYQMMPNVIGLNREDRKELFNKILFEYCPDKVLNEYNTSETLFEKFCECFEIKNKESKNNLWMRYAKSVISATKFINSFRGVKDFDNFVNCFEYNEYTAEALPMILEKEIYGLGFPLACDFLKELGYVQYPKPDIHIKDIFYALNLSENTDLSVYKSVIKMAKINNDTPYNVDKMFWLICSGKFYLHDLKIEGHKKEFIKLMKEELIV